MTSEAVAIAAAISGDTSADLASVPATVTAPTFSGTASIATSLSKHSTEANAATPTSPAAPMTDVHNESPLWGEGDPEGEGSSAMQSASDSYGYGYGYGYGELSPPVIINFTATELESGAWKFTGEVLDDDPVAGLSVRFGNLLNGYSATVRYDGTFELTHTFAPNTSGVISAIVTDIDGLESEEVQCGIS